MDRANPRFLAPLLCALAALGGGLLIHARLAAGTEADGAHALAGACILLAFGPPAVMAVLGRPALGVLRATLAAGIMTWFIATGRVDLGRIGGSLARWPWLAAGVLCVASQPVLGAVRWAWLLRGQDVRLGYGESLRLMLVGFFFNICLPGATGGDIFRAYAIGKETGKAVESVTTVALDRLSGLAAIILLAGGGLLVNLRFLLATPGLHEAAWILVAMLAGGVLLLAGIMSRTLGEALRRSPLGRWRFPGRTQLAQAYRAIHVYRGARQLLAGAVLVSIAAHLATAAGVACFARSLGMTDLPFLRFLVLSPLGMAFNAIPVTPGGVGQGQTAFSWLFAQAMPGREDAAVLGGTAMTLVHLALFGVAAVGAGIYAAGRHRLGRDRAPRGEAGDACEADRLACEGNAP